MLKPTVPVTDDVADLADALTAPPARQPTGQADPVEEGAREVVAVLGHELLTPLTAIQGVLDLVLAGIAGDVPPALRSLLETMHTNGRKLERTISNILDIERIERGAGLLNCAVLVVEDVIRRNPGVRGRGGASGRAVEVDCAGSAGAGAG